MMSSPVPLILPQPPEAHQSTAMPRISDAAPSVRGVEPYRVPFLFDRSRAPIYRLVNVGSERLRGVTAILSGSGIMPAVAPLTLEPSESVEMFIRGEDLARISALQLRWLRPSGEEFLWKVVF